MKIGTKVDCRGTSMERTESKEDRLYMAPSEVIGFEVEGL